MPVYRPTGPSFAFSVAPMMEVTDAHFRALARLLSREALLYSEMIPAAALVRGDPARASSGELGPVALQLGGSDPSELARAAEIGVQLGYSEIDLNVGCPSPRVAAGRFGACLMAEPELVADCVRAMAEAGLPVTVKHRLGTDPQSGPAALLAFVQAVAAAGAARVTVHARKADLGLTPRQNREIPPLRYDWVHALARQVPLPVVLNGGLGGLEQALSQRGSVSGVMLGRACRDQPFLLASVDAAFFGGSPGPTRRQAARAYLGYLEAGLSRGLTLPRLVRPLLGLFAGQPGGARFRRTLGESYRPGLGPALVELALRDLPDSVLDAPPAIPAVPWISRAAAPA